MASRLLLCVIFSCQGFVASGKATDCTAGSPDAACSSEGNPDTAALLQGQVKVKLETAPKDDNAEGAQQMRIGTCIKLADTNRIQYTSTSFLNAASVDGGSAPQTSFEFNDDPMWGNYNPSMVELPSLLRQGILSAKYAMTVRVDSHQCESLVEETNRKRFAMHASRNRENGKFLLLDANFCVVAVSSITVSGPVPRLAQDIRLFVKSNKLHASFVLFQYDPTRLESKGLWLAPIDMQHAPFSAALDISHAVRLGAMEEKNYGLFQYESKTMALTWLDDSSKRPPSLDGPDFMARPAAQKKGRWHNSANLLRLQDGSGDLLGMMHIHMDPKVDTEFAYGHGYKQKFFRLSGQPPYIMKAVGGEFCMNNSAALCESVQVVMSMVQTQSNEILVSYGVNDCHSRFSNFSLSSILQQMTLLPAGEKAVEDVMQVPEAQASLMQLAEVVSAAPLWRYGKDQEVDMAPAYLAGLQLQHSLHAPDRYESCFEVAGPYGDWPVCQDWMRGPTACVVYDFGIANEWQFSDSMALHHGCEVHSFDPSDAHLEQHRSHHQEGVKFHFLGLSNGDNQTLAAAWSDTSTNGYGSVTGPLQRLDAIMATLGHRAVDVLKIDCEGCEWESLAAVAQAAPEALACVHVLLIELHFARRFGGSNSSLISAAEVSHHLHSTGWKPWFAVQRGWAHDRREQELLGWTAVGGDSCCYNVGFVNPHFDANKCFLP